MKNLLSKSGNEWGKFLHKHSCKTEKVVSTTENSKEVHEHRSCKKEVVKELHCASTGIALDTCKYEVERPTQVETEKSREARKRVREEFKDIARMIDGETCGGYRVESFVPEKKLSLKRSKISVTNVADGTKDVYILGRNKIILKQYDKDGVQIKEKEKLKSHWKKGKMKFNSNKEKGRTYKAKDRLFHNEKLAGKIKGKNKSLSKYDKVNKEKIKFKDAGATEMVLDRLRSFAGVSFVECPRNCFSA